MKTPILMELFHSLGGKTYDATRSVWTEFLLEGPEAPVRCACCRGRTQTGWRCLDTGKQLCYDCVQLRSWEDGVEWP